MSTWAVTLSLAGFGFWMAALFLAVYLDLRIDAFKRAGSLPLRTPQLFDGFSRVDFGLLYSRRYREIDAHTRRLVPFVRVALPLGLLLGCGPIVWDLLRP